MQGLSPGAISLLVFLILISLIFLFSLRQPYVFGISARYLKGHAKMNMALMCAACISTSVITGSLIAGDSLTGSITDAVYENLSEVDEILVSDSLFNISVLDRLASNSSLSEHLDHLAPLIYLRGTAENTETGAKTRSADIIGFEDAFLDFGEFVSSQGKQLGSELGENEVYVNQELAEEIGVEIEDVVEISFTDPNQLYEAVFLGEQQSSNIIIQLVVRDIVRSDGLGRFQLNSNRGAPQNVYVSIDTMRKVLKSLYAVNMILISNEGDVREGERATEEIYPLLSSALNTSLGYTDSGLVLNLDSEEEYIMVESEDIFFSYDYYEVLSSDAEISSASSLSPILTYFWNTLTLGNRSVPYSTVTGFDSELDLAFGDFSINGTSQTTSGPLESDQIIINNWTADVLQASEGDVVEMNYSIMDDFYNINYLSANFTINHIVDMEGKANDSSLMPTFPGIYDIESPFDWNPPFTIDLGLIGEEDEDYWLQYKGTPKAFINLEKASELWATDIGNITQIRVKPLTAPNLTALSEQVKTTLNNSIGLSEVGLTLKPIKTEALRSAEEIEIFTQMFLAFSASCILASAVLIILLITLRIDSRMMEIGILRAMGFRTGTINNIFLLEGVFISIIGAALGVLFGLLFSGFLITGMNTFWSSVVEGSSVGFYYTADSLLIGFCIGTIISILTMIFAFRYESRRSVTAALRQLMISFREKSRLIPMLTLFIGIAILILGIFFMFFLNNRISDLELFFLSGFMLLCGFLLIFYHFLLKVGGLHLGEEAKRTSLELKGWKMNLAVKNAARKPKRTMFTVLLFSLTIFVLVSLTINLQGAVFDVEKAVEDSGGGFEIMGESTNPIYANLADEASRDNSNIYGDVYSELSISQFKTRGDVGCTCSNLNRAATPRLIAANESFFYDNSFVFVTHAKLEAGQDNPWTLLMEGIEGFEGQGREVPVIGDYNTVVWILGLDVGSTLSTLDQDGNLVDLKIVGIIGNSIFQGTLIMWDTNFEALFPTDDGYDLFLFRSDAEELKPQIAELETSLERFGFDAFTVESVVVENILIENTYISIFQVILVLGLLIGTLGFGIVAARNAMERTREIGILRAIGFSRKTITRSLMLENSFIVVSGIALGSVSGIIASSIYLVKLQMDITNWPWLYIAALLVLAYIFAMASAQIPIRRSSKMTVSEAIRVYE